MLESLSMSFICLHNDDSRKHFKAVARGMSLNLDSVSLRGCSMNVSLIGMEQCNVYRFSRRISFLKIIIISADKFPNLS